MSEKMREAIEFALERINHDKDCNEVWTGKLDDCNCGATRTRDKLKAALTCPEHGADCVGGGPVCNPTPPPAPAPSQEELCEVCGRVEGWATHDPRTQDYHPFKPAQAQASKEACPHGCVDGVIEEEPNFENAWGEHGLAKTACPSCAGTGEEPIHGEGHSKPAVCPKCGGFGSASEPGCFGPSYDITKRCPACNGTGKTEGER